MILARDDGTGWWQLWERVANSQRVVGNVETDGKDGF